MLGAVVIGDRGARLDDWLLDERWMPISSPRIFDSFFDFLLARAASSCSISLPDRLRRKLGTAFRILARFELRMLVASSSGCGYGSDVDELDASRRAEVDRLVWLAEGEWPDLDPIVDRIDRRLLSSAFRLGCTCSAAPAPAAPARIQTAACGACRRWTGRGCGPASIAETVARQWTRSSACGCGRAGSRRG